MKLTGDYTLFMDKSMGQTSGEAYKITEIEISKENGGSQYGKPLNWYSVKTKSAHGDYYNQRIGMIIGFTLRNNTTGEKTRYEIGKKPYAVV